MLAWENGYKIGNAEMDAQHLMLFALLNQLNININDDRAGECLPDVLNALCGYIDYHFAHEEALMRQWGYPQLEIHAEAHRSFVAEIRRLQAQMPATDPLKAGLKVRGFVLDWLLGHILETDQDYARFIAAKTDAG